MATYAVSGLTTEHGAWTERFLADLQEESDRRRPGMFTRLGAAPAGDPLLGARRADVVLALFSPKYFGDAAVVREWTVAAQRRMLGGARTGTTPRLLLPVRWQAIRQRLPAVAAELDVLDGLDLPEDYRVHGLAHLLRRGPRSDAAYRLVLAAVIGQMDSIAREATPVERREYDQPTDQPGPFEADDEEFTHRFREHLRVTMPLSGDGPPVDVPRRVAPVEAAGPGLLREQLPDLGRRLLLTGPPGSGRRRELYWLARAVLEERPGAGPWGCDAVLPLVAGPGGMPPVADLVQAVVPELGPEEPAGWAARRLRSGSLLLTLCGLEGLTSPQREALWEWVLAMREAYPDGPLAVATDGAQAPWARLGEGFARVRLQPWTVEETWAFMAFAARGPGRESERGTARALSILVGRDPVLRELTAWPAGAAAVWAAALAGTPGLPGGPLPGRGRLLDAAVAAAWRAAGEDAAGPSGRLARAARRLAVAALRGNVTELNQATAVEALGDGAEPDRRELVEALRRNPGVIHQPGPGRLAFAGAGLRDCLAAEELARGPLSVAVPLVLDHLRIHGSAEPVLLVARKLAGSRRSDFLNALLDAGQASAGRLLPLAVAAASADEGDDAGDEEAADGRAGADRPGSADERRALDERLRAALAELGPLRAADLPLVRRGGARLRRLLPEPERPTPDRPNGSAGLPGPSWERPEPARRLSAGPLPAPAPAGPREVRSAQELVALAAGPEAAEVTELHYRGPLEGLAGPLARLGGLRSLVLFGDAEVTELPDLSGCLALRTLVVRDCPGLADLGVLARSQIVFAEFDPAPPAFGVDELDGAHRLRRLDLVRERGGRVLEFAGDRVRVRVHGGEGLVHLQRPV